MIEKQTIDFLKKLKKNNNKTWFDANRKKYEAARIDFQNFIQLVIDHLGKSDTSIGGQTARECMFRINRDIRFSNDKTPYKTNLAASIKMGGKKSPFAGYYFHLEPGNSFIGGGLWMPEAADLKKVRQEIDYNWEEFKGIIGQKKFKTVFRDLYKGEDQRLSSMPKGYEKENPAAGYLKLKSFIAEVRLEDEVLNTGKLHRLTIEAFIAIKPLLNFLNRSIETDL
jgi:uncharacterized protein (TIGR02453 family)